MFKGSGLTTTWVSWPGHQALGYRLGLSLLNGLRSSWDQQLLGLWSALCVVILGPGLQG